MIFFLRSRWKNENVWQKAAQWEWREYRPDEYLGVYNAVANLNGLFWSINRETLVESHEIRNLSTDHVYGLEMCMCRNVTDDKESISNQWRREYLIRHG